MFRRASVELLSVAILPLGIGLAVADSRAPATVEPVQVAGPVSYARQVAPIFKTRCSECHSGDVSDSANLDLTTYDNIMKGSKYGTVVEAGDPDSSLLIQMVEDGEMPQDKDPVPAEEIAVIRSWIAAGAENN
jgi:mono/diheme cytochrome c family protein